MTREEKKQAIINHCLERSCENCELFSRIGVKERCYAYDANIEKNYNILFGNIPNETESAVEHPSHYAGDKYECIEVMLEVFGADAVKDFCLCNAFKYLWRCKKKHDNAVTDIKKAKFYLEEYIKLEEGEEADGTNQNDSIAEGS